MLSEFEGKRSFSVSRVGREQLHGIAELERLCFAEPWSEKSLELLLAENAAGFAAVGEAGELLGYAGLVTVLDEGQITNVATHPDHRRRGVASSLMAALIEYCRGRDIRYISLEVRASNSGAIALYEGVGFKAVGVRKNFYRYPAEDAVIMTAEVE